MSATEVAVLSYHGWEIDPNRLVSDVTALRAQGWREVALDDLGRADAAPLTAGRFFHVTLDDGDERDGDCVAALHRLSCPVTLFISLDVMSEKALTIHRELASSADVAIEDHSLRHRRVFAYRHVIGFHSDQAPLMTSPERLGLRLGEPVCAFGGELARPQFTPDPRAADVCRAAAKRLDAPPGSMSWQQALARCLVDSGLGFRRFGRLCVAGSYESRDAFSARLSQTLDEGRGRLAVFTGRSPTAFAHPWWQPSPTADGCLNALGYRLTFSGRGLHRSQRTMAIPRLFVSNDTPRPIDVYALEAASNRADGLTTWIRDVGRRAVYA